LRFISQFITLNLTSSFMFLFFSSYSLLLYLLARGRFHPHVYSKLWHTQIPQAKKTVKPLESFCAFIVKKDSITRSFCLHHYVRNVLSYLAKETRPMLCLKGGQATLASALLEQIQISCYTEYKAFGPSLIYNTFGIFMWKSCL